MFHQRPNIHILSVFCRTYIPEVTQYIVIQTIR